MNLVQDCIQVFSGKPIFYFRDRQKTLILALFQRCLKNPSLAKYRKDMSRISEYLEALNDPLKIWRDCEPYFPIDYLSRARGERFIPYLIQVLKLHIGMDDIAAVRGLPDGFYRLTNTRGRIFEVRGGRLDEVPLQVAFKIDGLESNVFFPMSGLFNDILDQDLYPRMRISYDRAQTKSHLMRALVLINEFSRDIWEDFRDAVWNIVLTTPRGVSSMSMRCRYFGGVFYNPFTNDEYRGVELLVHEYIHHRCALWWEAMMPTGIPSDDVFITSPMTGDEIRASFMIHAFIIYLSAVQFYRFIQATKLPSGQIVARRLNRRVNHLCRNMPLLYRRLNRVVKRNTDMKRLLAYLMEVYEPLKRDG